MMHKDDSIMVLYCQMMDQRKFGSVFFEHMTNTSVKNLIIPTKYSYITLAVL